MSIHSTGYIFSQTALISLPPAARAHGDILALIYSKFELGNGADLRLI
jgi:hypothetical protein